MIDGHAFPRWQLNRAGIMNVYQYGDEVLHFAGGRLLLRGVNGSGKSTAMNMLLPFLLEADTRRIDAAGEQSRVLHAWMLTGREEPQPVGYLWVEFRRGDEYLACGCGIRANRSTERVTTWWFVTDRRPGLDFSLVESRVPLSIDALRAVLGPTAVFNESQRPLYRAEVRARLFGGADVDQHLRLLHIVRSPRVGDRIAEDLPRYLSDALPQLSDAAIEDAAQPLEDLEEHRRNISDLGRTHAALDALGAVYASYAAHDLRLRALAATGTAATTRAARAAERSVTRHFTDAQTRRRDLQNDLDALVTEQERIEVEINALTSQHAYQAGAELTDLRERAAAAGRAVQRAESELRRRNVRARQRVDSANAAHAQHRADAGHAGHELAALAERCHHARLDVIVPLLPPTPSLAAATDEPPAPPEGAGFDLSLAPVLAAAQTRHSQISEVAAAVAMAERAETELRRCEQRAQIAADDQARATDAYATAIAARDEVARQWIQAVTQWVGVLEASERADGRTGQQELLSPSPTDDARHELATTLVQRAQSLVDERRRRAAQAHARLDAATDAVRVARGVVEELDGRTLPAAPALAWQRADRQATFAEWIDFLPGVDATQRAGIEAALEASGLLVAEVGPHGLTLVDGQALVVAREPAAAPLSELVTITAPVDSDPALADVVRQIVRSISTAPADGSTYVTVDGRFGMGSIVGRHRKETAEHIGLSARHAALERARDEARVVLAEREHTMHTCALALTAAEHEVAAGLELVATFPSAASVDEAVGHAALRGADLERATERFAEMDEQRRAAEETVAESVSTARRVAVERNLPDDRATLADVDRAARDTTVHCRVVTAAVDAAARSLSIWAERVDDWRQAVADAERARVELAELSAEHDAAATRLATLQDAIGAEYSSILAAVETSRADLSATRVAIATTRQAQLEAASDVARLEAQVAGAQAATAHAESDAVATLGTLRSAVAVAGYLEAATGAADRPHDAPVVIPVVAESAEGLESIAGYLLDLLPITGAEIGPDGVRQSLRQRRDALGAGWDAEDRQGDPGLPLMVEVTGPLGRMPLPDAAREVAVQVRSLEGLLSAKQAQALRNLLQGLIAKEVATKLHEARELIGLMNRRLASIRTSHGIGVSLRWARSDDLDEATRTMIDLLSKPPDLRHGDEDARLVEALSTRIARARQEEPDVPYRSLIAEVLDYRTWFRTTVMLHRPGAPDERLGRRTALSEGEKKVVSYLALFAAVAASCDALAQVHVGSPRFVLIDDAFAKVSEDNHPKLFGLLVELDLDFIATSERLWGTHDTVPELSITEVVRDATLNVIVLEHFTWNGTARSAQG